MTGKRAAVSTQEKNPRSTIVRSVFVALVALLPIMNITLAIIVQELRPYGEAIPGWVFGILNGGIVVTALAISIGTKIMAIPGFNEWLRANAPWLAPEDSSAEPEELEAS